MQKLIWTNANGDTVDLTKAPYGITNWEGFSNTSLNIQSQQVPFQDGGVFLDALIEQRELSVTLAIQDNNNLENRYKYRRELIHILNPKLGEGYLIYTNDFISKRIKCVAQIPLFETHNSNDAGTPKASLAWTSCEPYWEDLEETTIELAEGLPTIINNNGDCKTQLKINIIGSVENPQIVNLSTKKKIKVNGNYVNEPIKINTNVGEKSVTKNAFKISYQQGGEIYDIEKVGNQILYAGTQLFFMNEYGEKIIKKLPRVLPINWIVYVNDIYYAFSGDPSSTLGYVLKSSNLEDWTTLLDIQEEAHCFKYLNNKFLIGSLGKIYYSSDGENWNYSTLPQIDGNDIEIFSIDYSQELEKFVAVGSAGMSPNAHSVILLSTDGINWIDSGYQNTEYLTFVICGNGKVIVGGNFYTLIESTDGINWTEISGNFPSRKGYYENGLFIITGSSHFSYSADGINWNQVIIGDPYSFEISCIRYINHVYILSDSLSSRILQSKNLTDWIEINSGMKETIEFMQTNENRILMVSSSLYNCILYSDDGGKTILKKPVENIYQFFYGLVYGNGIFVAKVRTTPQSQNSNTLAISRDGLEWEVTQNQAENIRFVNNRFVKVTKGSSSYQKFISYSLDGISWSNERPISDDNVSIRSITYGLGKYFAVGENFTQGHRNKIIFSSNDLISWNVVENIPLPANVSVSLTQIVFDGTRFITIFSTIYSSYDGNCLVSSDGENWSFGIIYRKEVRISKMLYHNFRYYFIINNDYSFGNSNIIISDDFENWIATDIYTSEYLSDMTNYKNAIFFYGGSGTLLKGEESAEENIIDKVSEDSDMNLNLEVGENTVKLNSDSTNGNAIITFRKKYIGV